MDTHEAQRQVEFAVIARGYHDDFTTGEFGARNLAKLGEELEELSDQFKLPIDVRDAFREFGSKCRAAFDDRTIWQGMGPRGRKDAIRAETADCQVVLLNIAATYERQFGEPFDVIEAAVEKAKADVKRGVR